MPIIETPPSLPFGVESEYFQRLRQEYDNPIVIPENRNVLFFLKKDRDCRHFLCGKKNSKINKVRARRILWIKFILENIDVRVIKKDMVTNNILFICEELLHCVICVRLKSGDLKCFTHHPFKAEDLKRKYSDQSKFVDFSFN